MPGLPAKPVIDLMVGVEDIERAGPAVAGLINLGYEYVPEFESQLPDRRYFRLGTPETHHVHMVPVSGDFFEEHLLFRDWLRHDDADRRLYEETKRELARRDWDATNDYSEAKGAVVGEILARAHRWDRG